MSIYYFPGPVLSPGDTALDKTGTALALIELILYSEIQTMNKEMLSRVKGLGEKVHPVIH